MAVKDYTGKQKDAQELASRIRTYWHNRGYLDVEVWVEKDDKTQRKPIFIIRSKRIPLTIR